MDAPELQVIERPDVNAKALLKDLKGKQYLGAHEAIYWFTVEHPAPEGRIITHVDFEHSCVRAEIYIGDALIATGHSIGDGGKSLEKLETAAVRRALANAGYGTIAAMAEGDDDDAAKTAAKAAMVGKDIPTEVAREKMGQGKNRRMGGYTASNDNGEPTLTRADLDSALKDITHRIDTPPTGFARIVLSQKKDKQQAMENVTAKGFRILAAGGNTNWFEVDLMLVMMPH